MTIYWIIMVAASLLTIAGYIGIWLIKTRSIEYSSTVKWSIASMLSCSLILIIIDEIYLKTK